MIKTRTNCVCFFIAKNMKDRRGNKRMKDLTMYTCYNCKYFNTCGDATRTEPCKGKESLPTESACKEFMRDLRGTIYGNTETENGGIMSTSKIAEHLRITVERATDYLYECLKYGLTDRAEGMWVV